MKIVKYLRIWQSTCTEHPCTDIKVEKSEKLVEGSCYDLAVISR